MMKWSTLKSWASLGYKVKWSWCALPECNVNIDPDSGGHIQPGFTCQEYNMGLPGWIKWMIKTLILWVPFCFPQHDNGTEIVWCTSISKVHDFARRSHDSLTIDLRIFRQSQDIHQNCRAPLRPSNDAHDFIKCCKNRYEGLALILSSTKYKYTNLKERFILHNLP